MATYGNRFLYGGCQSPKFTLRTLSPMPDSTDITGKEINRIFKQLKKDETLMKATLLGGDGDGMVTIIIGIAQGKNGSYFKIDATADFRDRVNTNSKGKMLFEYDGNDRVPYLFRCVRAKIPKPGLWLRFPEFIERVQRRKHFRLKRPPGTTVLLVIDGKTYEADVMDISIGGVLITQAPSFQERTNLCVGDCIKKVSVFFPEDGERMQLSIKNAEIRRMVEKAGGHGYDYALQFHDIGKKDQEKLADFIYKCQRDKLILRRRNKQE